MLQEEGGVEPPNSDATAQQPTGLTLAEYAEVKRLPIEFLKQLGLSELKRGGQVKIQIPYLNEDGEEIGVRYRLCMNGDVRFQWKKGAKAALYGLSRLRAPGETAYVVLVVGESDAQTLWFHDFPALGLPFANSWQDGWAEHLNGIETIYVVLKRGKAGEAVKQWLARSPIRDRVRIIQLAQVRDVSALYLADLAKFSENWREAMATALPWRESEDLEKDQQAHEAWESCKALAEEPRILDRLAIDIAAGGLAGEERAIKLLYLIVTSRLLPRQVNAAVKGPSAAGKSYTVERVLRYFPPNAYYEVTSMSEKALIYLDEPMSHRILVMYEAAGFGGQVLSYLVRSLLSEGRIRYVTVEKVGDHLQSREIVLEGPTGLITTTTRVSLHPENETRSLSIPINDSPRQTEFVMAALGLAAEEGNPISDAQEEFEQWHALQTWLEGAEHRVVIPFARILAKRIPPVAVRLRRDFPTILNLIWAHTILHQATRERDSAGRIVATIEDYAVVRELVGDLLAEGVEVSVPETIRETVAAVRELLMSSDSVNASEVGQHLGLDRSSAKRRVDKALESGYLKNLERYEGRPSQLVLGDDMPEEQPLLPLPEDLAAQGVMTGCTVADDSGGYTPSSSIDEWEYFEL